MISRNRSNVKNHMQRQQIRQKTTLNKFLHWIYFYILIILTRCSCMRPVWRHYVLSPTYEYSWAILHRDWSTPHRAVPSFHAVDRFLTSPGVSRLTRGVSVYWHMLINIHDADGGRQSIAPCSWRHSWRITAVTGDSYLRIMRIYSLNSINNLLLNYL